MGRPLAAVGSPADTIFCAEATASVNNQLYWASDAANPTLPLTPFASYSAASSGENNSFHLDTKSSPAYFGYQDSSSRRYLVLGRHSGVGNVLFCDGHAKGMQMDQVGATHPVQDGSVLRNVFFRWTAQDD